MNRNVRDKVLRVARSDGVSDLHATGQHLPGVVPRLPPTSSLATKRSFVSGTVYTYCLLCGRTLCRDFVHKNVHHLCNNWSGRLVHILEIPSHKIIKPANCIPAPCYTKGTRQIYNNIPLNIFHIHIIYEVSTIKLLDIGINYIHP